ncbi:hypothetical protein EV207_10256 [Scopulibacillus darangshiensis]|uniref:Uncharacterized protein n=1 Tax=Scopulibacillus darangshiensis TaxID=442528 RepID=A0A4R2P9H8_9BACL|nr:hypothetical protein EV207_10256 [Scopulibacillus darangshiensis]
MDPQTQPKPKTLNRSHFLRNSSYPDHKPKAKSMIAKNSSIQSS